MSWPMSRPTLRGGRIMCFAVVWGSSLEKPGPGPRPGITYSEGAF